MMEKNSLPGSSKVLYLMCTELIANHGIFETQVKSLLETITQKYGRYRVHFLSLAPILRFRKWYIEFVFTRYAQAFSAIIADLQEHAIRGQVLPLVAAYPFLSMRPVQLLFALPLALHQVMRYVRQNGIDVVHCRSYPAGFLGLLTHKLTGAPFIFDPRSLWPEEQLLIGAWHRWSPAYVFWKSIETSIVKNASTTVVVSDPMVDFYPQARHTEVIYTTASEQFFHPQETNFSPVTQAKLSSLRSLSSSRTLLVFSTNRFNRWNDLDHLVKRYKQLRETFESPALVVFTRTPKTEVIAALKAKSVPENEIWIGSFEGVEMAAALRCCHYGLLVRPRSTLSPIIMSVKMAEYLASGLPVFCEAYLGGAAHVINQHHIGVVLTDDWDENRHALQQICASYDETSQRCKRVAEELFSVDVHAERYTQLYQEALA
jgi:glycosyltransferase involved in cell wall biosynthesis